MADINIGKFINNLDKEDLSSEDLQGVVNNVYAKAISDHKKRQKTTEDNTKEQDKETATFIKANHDRLKAHKKPIEKDIDKDDATAKDKVAKEINESFANLSNKEKIDYVIDNYKKITGRNISGVYAKGMGEDENAPVFNQDHIDATADRIEKFLKKNGMSSKEIDDFYYDLDAELASRYNELSVRKPKGKVNEAVAEYADTDRETGATIYKDADTGRLYANYLTRTVSGSTVDEVKDKLSKLQSDHINHFRNLPESKKINEETILPGNIHNVLVKKIPAKDIDHYNSDLYVRKTPQSTEIINKLSTKSLLSTFKDNIDGDIWYELPFCYNPHLEKKESTKVDESASPKDLYWNKEEALKDIWGLVCEGDDRLEDIRYIFESGLLKPNEFRYDRFGAKHSLIMGALRNGNYKTVELLKSLGEKILKSEVEEYKDIMAKRVYSDETVRGALDESRLAYYKYRGCTVRETPSTFVAINEHGLNIGESPTAVGAEGIIDDYLKKQGVKDVVGGQPKREGSFAEKHPNIKLKKESLKEELSDEDIFDILGIEQENRTNSKHLLSQFRRLQKKYGTDSIWLKGDVGSAVKGKVIGRSNDLAVVESKQVNESEKVVAKFEEPDGSKHEIRKRVNDFANFYNVQDKGSDAFHGVASAHGYSSEEEARKFLKKHRPQAKEIKESKKLKESEEALSIDGLIKELKKIAEEGTLRENNLTPSDFYATWDAVKELKKTGVTETPIQAVVDFIGFNTSCVIVPKGKGWKIFDTKPGEVVVPKGDDFVIKECTKESLKEDWTIFEFTSGSNPYIAKTDKEVKRLLRKYKNKVKKINDTHYEVDDRTETDNNFDLFPVRESKKLEEGKSSKKLIYTIGDRFVAHQLDGITSPFNREFDAAKKYRDISNDPNFKHGSIGCKGKSYKTGVNQWVKDVEPTEFMVWTKKENPSWKDDVLDVYYRKETVNESKKLTEAEDGNMTIETSTSILDMFYPSLYQTIDDYYIPEGERDRVDDILARTSIDFAEDAIKEVFPSATLKFKELIHPRQYNFGGENIIFDVTLPKAEYEKVKQEVVNDPKFAEFLKKNSPRSGYIPFGAYTVDKFKTQDDMYSLGQIVKFLADSEDLQYDFDDKFREEISSNFETYDYLWEEVMDWLKEHDQAYQDFLTHFNADENSVIDLDSIIDWISEHDTLAQDFENYFGFSINESLKEDIKDKKPYIVAYLGKEIASFDHPAEARDYYERKTYQDHVVDGYWWGLRSEMPSDLGWKPLPEETKSLKESIKERYKDVRKQAAYENACDCIVYGYGKSYWNSLDLNDEEKKEVWKQAFNDIAETESLKESQSQEIEGIMKDLKDKYGDDIEDKMTEFVNLPENSKKVWKFGYEIIPDGVIEKDYNIEYYQTPEHEPMIAHKKDQNWKWARYVQNIDYNDILYTEKGWNKFKKWLDSNK